MTTNDGTVGRYLRWFLAALSVGAGVIHFAVSGGHFDVSWTHGAFFAVVAWLQLGWAAAVVLKPTRRVLLIGAVGNAFIIVTWAMSRVWGVPVGPDAWTPEQISLADALASGFEAVLVVMCGAVLVHPSVARRRVAPRFGGVLLAGSALAVAIVSTLALTPSFASDHHGGGEAAHGSAHDGDGHDGEGHDGDGHTGVVIQADGSSACELAAVANEGNSGHGHRGPVAFTPLDDATRLELADQVALSNQAVAAYPTVKEAEAAGWRRVTPYVPCIAAHYLKSSALMNPFDPAEPEILLYDGDGPDSRIVGLSYLVFADKDTPPEGFAGPNDPWHVHRQLCIGGGGVLGDESSGPEECEGRGGRVVPLENLWMTHMWNVAGWESRWGLFSSEHPDLGGVIGDINATPDGQAAAES